MESMTVSDANESDDELNDEGAGEYLPLRDSEGGMQPGVYSTARSVHGGEADEKADGALLRRNASEGDLLATDDAGSGGIHGDIRGSHEYGGRGGTPSGLRLRRTGDLRAESPLHFRDSHPHLSHAHDYEDNDLEIKREELNTVFGFRPNAAIISRAAAREQRQKVKSKLGAPANKAFELFGQVVWLVLFGWWLSLLYLVAAVFMYITVIGASYGRAALSLARFVLWPFGVFLVRDRSVTAGVPLPEVPDYSSPATEQTSLVAGESPRPHGVKANVGFVLWFIPGVVLLAAHALCWAVCWFFVVTIPLSKISSKMLFLIPHRDVVQLRVEPEYPGAGAEIILFATQSVNRYYVFYSVAGFNIVLLNLLPLVLVSLIVGYIFPLIGLGVVIKNNPIVMFVVMLLSIIPLSYYIGLAIASLAAQTNAAIGSVLNATFGSAVELILYFFALNRGLHDLVTGGIIGSLLGCTLLLPGLSMVAGGFKYQRQYFNKASAGVSSVMLTVSIVGAFTPTVFYQTYGDHQLGCSKCVGDTSGDSWTCAGCRFTQFSNFDEDPVWVNGARPLMYSVSALLPIAYMVGILFVLKTHTKIIFDDDEGHGGHEAPEWSKTRCMVYLLIATTLLALIAEELVQVLEPTIEILGLDEYFVGLVVVALIPSTAEFVNAIRFALEDNIALSVEVGSAYAVQTALIQIPVLVWFSAIAFHGDSGGAFVLVFDQLATFAIIVAVITFNYVTTSSECNYFLGASLVIIYLIFILAFFWAPKQGTTSH